MGPIFYDKIHILKSGELTGFSSAASLRTKINDDAALRNSTGILIQAQAQNIRLTFDGTTTPTASLGYQLASGKDFLVSSDASLIQIIEEAASAKVFYMIFRRSFSLTKALGATD